MPAQKGKDLLLKADTTGGGSFTTVAGLRSRSIVFNSETVDITHQASSGQWSSRPRSPATVPAALRKAPSMPLPAVTPSATSSVITMSS